MGRVAYVDHRRVPFAPEEFGRAVTELWTLVPDARYEATAVHALDAHGTVINFVIEGTDIHGSELQWPRTFLIFFGDGETRMDVFEVDDVDAALARFDELSRPAPRLENAASRAVERYLAHFPARGWDVMSEMLADDFWADDRRRVVNTGVRKWPGCRDRQHAGHRRTRVRRHFVDPHCDPRGAPRPSSSLFQLPRCDGRGVDRCHRVSTPTTRSWR